MAATANNMTKEKEKQYLAYDAKGAPTYSSQYQSQMAGIMDQIANRKAFSYDFNADPLYQQYKDQYTALGAQAAQNATASAATMTGGYGNSYATQAATQANQQYLNQLNNVIPELYSAAMDKYNNETQNLYNQFNMYGDAEDRAYNQYQSQLNQYNTDRSYYYQQYADAVANDQWQKQYDTSNEQWQKQFDASNDQWQKEYDFSREQWEYQKAQAEAKAASSGGSGGRSSKKSSGGSSDDTTTEKDKNGKPLSAYATDISKQAKKMIKNGSSKREVLAYIATQAQKYGLNSGHTKNILQLIGYK